MNNGPSAPTGSGTPPGEGDRSRGSSGGRSPARTALEHAQSREHELRARIAELVTERRRLWQESKRLQVIAERTGADPRLDDVAVRYQAKATELGRELEEVRAQLRAQEAVVAEHKADLDGV